MAFLQLDSGVEPGKRFELTAEESVIGRSSECQVSVDLAAVSRRHAIVIRQEGQFFLKDLGSRNGTLLNGTQVVAQQPLRDGSRITVCDQEFTFHDDTTGGLLGPQRSSTGDTSMAELFNDANETSQASVVGTLDLTPGSTSWSMSAQPEVKLAALVEISNNLSNALSIKEILPRILDSLFKIFVQADRAFIVMRPQPDAPLVPVDWRNRRGRTEDDEAPRLSRTIIEQAMDSRKAIRSADAASDERFGMAQSIAEFKIRSMMCVPMIDADGKALGVIQIDTTNQRSQFNDDDLEVLAGVANQAAVSIDKVQMHEQVLSQRALQRDLELAAQMQRALLPSAPPPTDDYDFFSYYESARQVGGDYYDYIPLPDGRFAVIVGDVAGKGVSAAILMARLSSDVRFSLASEHDLTRAVMRVNESFARQGWQDRFVTMIFAVVDPRTHVMTMVNAGHMGPLIRSATGVVEEIAEDIAGLPIGVYDDYEYESMTRELAPGDSVTIFTDGFSEAMNSRKDLYGLERLAKVVATEASSTAELGERILTDVRQFVSGYPQSDDMCLACFGRNLS